MKTAEEIFGKLWTEYNQQEPDEDQQLFLTEDEMELVYAAINQARKEAIEECIEVVNEQMILGHLEFIIPSLEKRIKELK